MEKTAELQAQISTGTNVSINNETPIQKDFCQAWPDAKIGLNLLAQLVKNPIVKWVITIVIEAGDGLQGIVCPNNQ